ncbi:MAG: hypothetical protein ABSF34_10890 [Verrucomicrobiota bacterium]
MENDPLAKYRRTPPAPQGGIMRRNDGDEYAAFGTKDKVHRLKIRSLPTLVHSPGYNLLLDIVSDGQYGTSFILVYSVLLVMVRGKNLQKTVFAIESGMADFIQAFDPERWQKPKDDTAAFIESIEIQDTERTPMGDKKH